jgi:murein L,D-transpeptidase YcbB/YkuD
MKLARWQVAIVLAGSVAAGCGTPTTTPELQAVLAGSSAPTVGAGLSAAVSSELWPEIQEFYAARDQQFAWVAADGPIDRTFEVLDALRGASTHGLDPTQYGEPELRAEATRLSDKTASTAGDTGDRARAVAELDVRLTAALLQLGRHVAVGRLSPRVIDKRWNAHREPPDYGAALRAASNGAVSDFFAAVQPRHPEYQALRDALARVDTVAIAGVKDATVDQRRQAIALNLERWRWLPDDLGARHFLVNVPEYHLYAREQGRVALDMRVIVGKRGNETPLFSDEMETVVFSPYWHVPETIAMQETLPSAMNDPDFLRRNNMEIVNSAGQIVSASEIPWDDEGALAEYRFRQRPGPNNALGFVKFLFPNQYAVYLHDTPTDALFERIGRAFSHGCVRVEEPERLAEYVLRDQGEWTPEAIRRAMRAGTERHVRLREKIPVHIVYMTAWVTGDGVLHLANDVYGYDRVQAAR